MRQLTTGSYDCNRPGWSRDGHWVYFRSRVQIWKMPAARGAAIQVTRNGRDEPFESWDGKSVYYHKADAIWKVSTAGGQETQLVDHAVRGHWSLLSKGICLLNRENLIRRWSFSLLPTADGEFSQSYPA